MIMEKKEVEQESKVAKMRRMIEEICKKHGWKVVDREPNREVFMVSFKKKRDTTPSDE